MIPKTAMSECEFVPESGRRYLIAGGTSGIGAVCARHLTGEGHAGWVTGTCEQMMARALHDWILAVRPCVMSRSRTR